MGGRGRGMKESGFVILYTIRALWSNRRVSECTIAVFDFQIGSNHNNIATKSFILAARFHILVDWSVGRSMGRSLTFTFLLAISLFFAQTRSLSLSLSTSPLDPFYVYGYFDIVTHAQYVEHYFTRFLHIMKPYVVVCTKSQRFISLHLYNVYVFQHSRFSLHTWPCVSVCVRIMCFHDDTGTD